MCSGFEVNMVFFWRRVLGFDGFLILNAFFVVLWIDRFVWTLGLGSAFPNLRVCKHPRLRVPDWADPVHISLFRPPVRPLDLS